LICIDSADGKELGTWGARPKKISEMAADYKAKNQGVAHSEFVKNLHLWYARDKGEALQQDLLELIERWIGSE
jgi:hypothetical protein